jgi:hypothetical protein
MVCRSGGLREIYTSNRQIALIECAWGAMELVVVGDPTFNIIGGIRRLAKPECCARCDLIALKLFKNTLI